MIAICVAWLYSKRLDYAHQGIKDDEDEQKAANIVGTKYSCHLRLCIMRDAMQDEDFQNATMDTMIEVI
jgi:hypothetical protein